MRVKTTIIFFLLLSALMPQAWAADFGEDEIFLGQIVDDYENDDNIAAMINTINNATLNCMELNYSMVDIANYEDFEVYTELDPTGKVTINSPTLFTWDELTRGNALTYVDEDYGAAYFGQNFVYSFNLNITEAEAGDGSDSDFIYVVSFGNTNHNPLTDPRITILVQQNAASDTDYYIYFRIDDVHAGWDFDLSILLDVAKMYHLILGRVNGDDLYLTINDENDLLVDHLTVNLVNFDDNFRYISALHKRAYGADMADWVSGTLEFLWNGSTYPSGGFEANGSYYTVNVLDSDPALAILYNLTIPAGGGATMEFSTDNVTWVDHNNQAGFDVLVDGYEALDLRDIYNGTLFRRVNFTRGLVNQTLRMWQARLVTVTDVDCPENFTIYENVTGAWVDYNFTSISTLVGTHIGGFLNSTYFKDDNWYTVNEAVGAPGYDIRFNVTGLPDNLICVCLDLFMSYDGSVGHTFQIEVWNFTDSNWDFIEDIPDECCQWFNNTLECVPADYVYNGTLMGRFYHPSPGNVNHVWGIDYGKVRVFVPYPVTATGPSLFPGLAIGIALLIIGAIYALEKRR